MTTGTGREGGGTVRALVDDSGDTVESYRYDAWGNVMGVFDGNGGSLPSSVLGLRYLFQGREYSWATHAAWGGAGLYYFRARYYDPSTGRWLSNDPIGISGGLNQYAFCANNPVMFLDPEGRVSFFSTPSASAVARAVGLYAVPSFLGIVYVRLNYSVGGEVAYAFNVNNTGIILVGENYYSLHPLAREEIDAHEDRHTVQGPFYPKEQAENEAYLEQYKRTKALLDTWGCGKTKGHPAGSKAFNDIWGLNQDAKQYLRKHAPHMLK
jgi:RHS repeat-associated protein